MPLYCRELLSPNFCLPLEHLFDIGHNSQSVLINLLKADSVLRYPRRVKPLPTHGSWQLCLQRSVFGLLTPFTEHLA